MADDQFNLECDRLSRVVDPEAFENLEWARTDGAALEAAAKRAMQALEHREDLELVAEPSDDRRRRFVLRTKGSNPIDIATLWMKVEGEMIALWPEAIVDSKFKVSGAGRPFLTRVENADEAWLHSAIGQAMARVDHR
ncbi:MAG TPA: hypothetical protein VFP12_11875 [Allosphingosinicella sp.]|nr:hypothetical protein [Allosphingosinicella sp.]